MRITIKIDNDNKPGVNTSIVASDEALKMPMALVLEALKDLLNEQEDIVANKAVDLMGAQATAENIENASVLSLSKIILQVTVQQCTHIGNGSNYSTHN